MSDSDLEVQVSVEHDGTVWTSLMFLKQLQTRRYRSGWRQEVSLLGEETRGAVAWRRRVAPSRGLRLLGGASGDDLLKVLAAQQVLRDALALLKLGQDDGDVAVGGRLPEERRQTASERGVQVFE